MVFSMDRTRRTVIAYPALAIADDVSPNLRETMMGTRADFYVGKGKDAEWIGSIAWDGYRDGIDEAILKAADDAGFRAAVEAFFKSRDDDATLPAQGWPWPWNDSSTSDCSYWFFDGQTWDALGYPHEFFYSCREEVPQDADERYITDGHERVEFPDMSARKNVTLGPRSGVIVMRG